MGEFSDQSTIAASGHEHSTPGENGKAWNPPHPAILDAAASDCLGASAAEVTGKHEQPQRVDSGYQPCASVSIATPELGSENTTLEIVTRNRAHFCRELRA
jgi:hypothetical protein